MGLKGTGWLYKVEKQSLCRNCNRRPTFKPKESCPIEHEIYYTLKLTQARQERIETLQAYGKECSCCGFDDFSKTVFEMAFLQLDHVDGKGQNERKILKNTQLYRKLKKLGFPKGYRVLCAACNVSMKPGETICEYHKWVQVNGSKGNR